MKTSPPAKSIPHAPKHLVSAQFIDNVRQCSAQKIQQRASAAAMKTTTAADYPNEYQWPRVLSTFPGSKARTHVQIPPLLRSGATTLTVMVPLPAFRQFTTSNSTTSRVPWINSKQYNASYELDFKGCFDHLLTKEGCPRGSQCDNRHLPPQEYEREWLVAVDGGKFLEKVVRMWLLRRVQKGADTLTPTPVGGQLPSPATIANAPKTRWTLASNAVTAPTLQAVYNEWTELGVEQIALDSRQSSQMAQQLL